MYQSLYQKSRPTPPPPVPPSSRLPPPPSSSVRSPDPVLITGPPLARVSLANGQSVLNFATANTLGLAGREDIYLKCVSTIEKYGLGACGPRGFYGTIDVHLDLEKRLARFLGTEESILYSYDVATISSVIPAFAKKGDVILSDDGAHWAIEQGCQLARAHHARFAHNEPSDLVRNIEAMEYKLRGRPRTRRFIVVEGVYHDTGDVCRLREGVAVAKQYKYRVILDDSWGIGFLGTNGRGSLEHRGLSVDNVMAVVGSLGGALGGVGGFCAGTFEVVDHQRLAGSGYCFSAALPPFLATAAITALDILSSSSSSSSSQEDGGKIVVVPPGEGRQLVARARANATSLRKLLAAQLPSSSPPPPTTTTTTTTGTTTGTTTTAPPPSSSGGHPTGTVTCRVRVGEASQGSPMVIVEVEGGGLVGGRQGKAGMEAEAVVEALVTRVREGGVLVAATRQSFFHTTTAGVGLKVLPMATHTEADLVEAAEVIARAVRDVVGA